MSCAEIMSVLFFHEMRWDPKDPAANDVDMFVMSKGHAAPILWAALKEAGALPDGPDGDLNNLRKIDCALEGHPTFRSPWCRVATGSLDGTLLTWSPATISNHCQNGQISCTGAFCGTAGSPPEDEPEILTDACSDQPITDFVFDAALESFEMETVVVSMDANATAAIQFTGTLLSAELDKATPSCLCP